MIGAVMKKIFIKMATFLSALRTAIFMHIKGDE